MRKEEKTYYYCSCGCREWMILDDKIRCAKCKKCYGVYNHGLLKVADFNAYREKRVVTKRNPTVCRKTPKRKKSTVIFGVLNAWN